MKVLFATAEAAPLAKVGGLADVAGGLPGALRSRSLDVRVIMPLYSLVDSAAHGLADTGVVFEARAEQRQRLAVRVWEGRIGTTPVSLLEEPQLLARSQIYGCPDDLARFTFFCRAVMQACPQLGFRPDVIHANDWHTGLLPVWLKMKSGLDSFYRRTASVLTIHNLAFQGWFDEAFRGRWKIAPRSVVERKIAGVSLQSALALGIRYADAVTTVSPTYAREILTPEFGEGLDPLLAHRSSRGGLLFGIMNGIDVDRFDPSTDPHILPNYAGDSLERKLQVKMALQREAGLQVRPDVPLVGMVSRLTEQKGAELVPPAVEALLQARELQLAVLGTGERGLEETLAHLARRHPERVSVALRFDPDFAQRIYAGADLFLMPSRFEPCGLGQMIAMRYGTVPVVRSTGGLTDSVREWRASGNEGTGFTFERYGVENLVQTLSAALELFEDRPVWRAIQRRGMSADFSWERSAASYAGVYESALRAKAKMAKMAKME